MHYLLNGSPRETSLPEGETVLNLIRGETYLYGTKSGCREGDCGACTVLLGRVCGDGVEYRALNSCILPVGELRAGHLVTVEGLETDTGLTLVQRVIAEKGASQCGFCTPGIVMSLTGYLLSCLRPDTSGAIISLGGNICRCTGYLSIMRAASMICGEVGESPASSSSSREHLAWLVEKGVLPTYFIGIHELLRTMETVPGANDTGNGVEGIAVAGGTDLFAVSADEMRHSTINFLGRDRTLHGIRLEDDTCRIGSAETIASIEDSGMLRELDPSGRIFSLISSTQIRNSATIGGNIVNASPIGDLSIILLALGARLHITGPAGDRTVELRDFYRGYKQLDLNQGELVREVSFTMPGDGQLFNFEKVSMRKHLDIASVNSAACLRMKGTRIEQAAISAGGIAPIPLYLKKASSILSGEDLSPELIKSAASAAMDEAVPISDVRGSAEYKQTLLRNLVYAHFQQFFPELLKPEDLS